MLRPLDRKIAYTFGIIGVIIVLCPYVDHMDFPHIFGGMLIGICIGVLSFD